MTRSDSKSKNSGPRVQRLNLGPLDLDLDLDLVFDLV
jgi:hypothetical protein